MLGLHKIPISFEVFPFANAYVIGRIRRSIAMSKSSEKESGYVSIEKYLTLSKLPWRRTVTCRAMDAGEHCCSAVAKHVV
jgi:hypothetical protein